MADYFTTFSCLFDVGNAENVARASKIREALATELDCDDGAWPGFAMTPYSDGGTSVLWLHSEEHGEPEHVIRFVLRCAEAFDLQGLWGFCWGLTCSRLRLDGFGGGAQLIDLGSERP